MNVVFYNTKIKKNEVNKTLGTGTTISCELKNGSSIEDPVLLMTHNATMFNYNYAYIADFGRYYFIAGREIVEHTEYITCHVDVIKSFADDIKASKGTATRSNFYNKNIPDSMALNIPQDRVQYRKLSEAMTGQTYIVIIGG